MALMRKYALKENYVQVPNATAKAVEINLSLQALGLITNIWSYNVETWELHKTELYKRYVKNKKTSVSSAWDELVELNYIIEFKYRRGKSWEYVYIYRIEPFTEEEKEQILVDCVEEYGVSSTSDFQLLKFNSSFSTVQNQHISNIKEKKNNIKEILRVEEEEEGGVPLSELVMYLIQNGIDEKNAIKFENRLLSTKLKGYTKELCLQAIDLSLIDFEKGIADEPYLWAVGKLERLLDDRLKMVKPTKPKKQISRTLKKEIVPEWFKQDEQIPEQLSPKKQREFAERRRRLLESLGQVD